MTRGGTETIAASSRPGRLREALSVLVDNALMHGAGQCRIEIGELSSGLVRITVRDDGPGVADDLAVMIFRRGFSVGRGNGVGLSLARALIEADGGRLELGSRRPPVFSIVVPAWPADDMTGDDTTGGGSSAGRSRGLGSAGLADPTRSPEITRGRVPHR